MLQREVQIEEIRAKEQPAFQSSLSADRRHLDARERLGGSYNCAISRAFVGDNIQILVLLVQNTQIGPTMGNTSAYSLLRR